MNPRERIILLFLFTLIVGLGTYSPSGEFISYPKFWFDEGFTVEIARTITEIGRADVTIAPNTPSNVAITLNANGFPLSIPLALLYKIVGVDLFATRIFTFIIMLFTLGTLFKVARDFFDTETALIGLMLVGTFASFFANAKTATGDSLGILFMLLAVWLLLYKEKFILGGFAMGLATVTKVSLFHLSLPATAVALILIYKKDSLKPLWNVIWSSALIGIVWIILLAPRPYSLDALMPALQFYGNPINKPSVLQSLPESIRGTLLSSTIIYFGALLIVVVFAFRKRYFENEQRALIIFTFVYAAFQFFAFLRTPGWMRYLIALQVLLLILLYPSIKRLLGDRLNHKILLSGFIFLAGLHITQYLFFSDIFEKPNPTINADAIMTVLNREPQSTVGFINDPVTASLIPGDRKYQIINIGGDNYAGRHPLDYPPDEMPKYIFANGPIDHPEIIRYRQVELDDGVRIWEKN